MRRNNRARRRRIVPIGSLIFAIRLSYSGRDCTPTEGHRPSFSCLRPGFLHRPGLLVLFRCARRRLSDALHFPRPNHLGMSRSIHFSPRSAAEVFVTIPGNRHHSEARSAATSRKFAAVFSEFTELRRERPPCFHPGISPRL